MPDLRPLVLLMCAAVLAACGGTSSPSAAPSTPTSSAPSSPTSSAAPTGPFASTLYGYAVRSHAWSGTSATATWDGTGAPGDGDPTVDTLVGPEGQRAFVYGAPSRATLKKFVARSRAVGAKARPECAKPEATRATAIDREPAIVDEVHCGVFALAAFVVHHGRAYVFFTYDQPGNEAGMRAWFGDLLAKVDLKS